MFNLEKSEYYRTKLPLTSSNCDGNYKYKLMYETSWKLPISIKYLDS